MKLVPTLASVIFLLWTCHAVLRVPPRQITWAIPAYVIAQMFFTLIGWLALQKWTEEWEGFHSNYQYMYFALFSINCLLACVISMRFLVFYPVGVALSVILGGIGMTFGTCVVVGYRLLVLFEKSPKGVGMDSWVIVGMGAIMCLCGYATLMALPSPMTPAMKICAFALSIFWLAMGAYFFCFVLGIQTELSQWKNLNLWLVPMIAIVCFGYMAKRLNPQAELAPQAVTSDRMQTQVAQ